MNFDGADKLLDVGSDTSIDNIFDTNGASVEAWVYVDSDGENNEGRIYDKAQWYLYVNSEAASKVKVTFHQNFSGDDGTWTTTTTAITVATWTHVVLTYDADAVANNPILYINGVTEALTEASTPVGTRDTDAANNLYIGNNATPNRAFDGKMSRTRLYTGILTAAQIRNRYINTKTDYGL